jgi:hypothetical protein
MYRKIAKKAKLPTVMAKDFLEMYAGLKSAGVIGISSDNGEDALLAPVPAGRA